MMLRRTCAVAVTLSCLCAGGRGILAADKKEPTAEEWLRRVEDKYAGAKTVQWRAKVKLESPRVPAVEADVTAHLKQGNKFDLVWQTKGETHRLTSDGKKVVFSFLNPGNPVDLPKDVATAHRGLMSRSGCGLFLGALRSPATEADLDKAFAVRTPKIAGREKVGERAAVVLTFDLRSAKGLEHLDCSQHVWVDIETYAALKIESSNPKSKAKITESRFQVEFDVDIPDKRFDLSK